MWIWYAMKCPSMGTPETQAELVDLCRMLAQQISQVGRWPKGCRDGQQHKRFGVTGGFPKFFAVDSAQFCR